MDAALANELDPAPAPAQAPLLFLVLPGSGGSSTSAPSLAILDREESAESNCLVTRRSSITRVRKVGSDDTCSGCASTVWKYGRVRDRVQVHMWECANSLIETWVWRSNADVTALCEKNHRRVMTFWIGASEDRIGSTSGFWITLKKLERTCLESRTILRLSSRASSKLSMDNVQLNTVLKRCSTSQAASKQASRELR